MKLTKTILAIPLIIALSACNETDKNDNANWYRDIRTNDWAWSGADEKVMDSVLTKLTKLNTGSGEKLDLSVKQYTPGNWEYEWDNVGAIASSNQNYLAASMYYTVAAYPFINENALSVKSYKKAVNNYEKAVKQAGFRFEELTFKTQDGDAVAYLHLPAGKVAQEVPLLIVTNGSDHAFTQAFSAYKNYYSKAGYAMISFDLPGLGSNGKLTQNAARTNIIHQQVIKYVKSDKRFNNDKIVLLAKSFGGNAAVKTAFTNQQDIAAVVSWCGAVNDPFLDFSFSLKVIEKMTADALMSRFNLSKTELANEGVKLALSNTYLGKTTTSVPILSINHANDPVNPISDMQLVTSSSPNGSIKVIDENVSQGHCSSEEKTLPEIMNWLAKKV